MSFKLFYRPGVCSLAVHIVLREAGLPFELDKVDKVTKKTESGLDFLKVSPKGKVPTLKLENGEILTEGPAITQYLADLRPESGLAPANGTLERARLQEWLNYIGTEMHKLHWAIFYVDEAGEKAREACIAKLRVAYDTVSERLKDRPYLLGKKFSVADAYLFTVVNWSNFFKFDLSPWPVLVAYQARVAARPAVEAAMEAEGLLAAKSR
jgi:glutathione S-transferase